MSNLSRSLVLAATLLLGATGASWAADPPLTLHFRADVTIEPDGSLSRVEWQDAEKIPGLVRDRLDRHVATWTFEPGTVDGQQAVTQSSLRIRLLAERAGDGLSLRIMDARTGARLAPVPAPAYPREALYSREEGAVLARFVAEPGGARTLHIDGYAGERRFEDEFTASVEAMFADVDVVHELVGGRPAPATFSMPITFCIDHPVCHEGAFAGEATADTASTPGSPVPVDSVARLLTDVRGTSI